MIANLFPMQNSPLPATPELNPKSPGCTIGVRKYFTLLDLRLYLCYTVSYEFIYRYKYCVTQQPFELKLTMPPTDRGGRGYSDEYVSKVTKELLT